MNYVDSFNFLGTDVKEIPCIVGEGEPTTSTVGEVGLLYMNISSSEKGELWKCIEVVDDTTYIWEKLIADITRDWNQNDPDAKDYIKNRPFYIKSFSIINENLTAQCPINPTTGFGNSEIIVGNKNIFELCDYGTVCKIIIDDKEYVDVIHSDYSCKYIGNGKYLSTSLADTGEPFVIWQSALDCIGYRTITSHVNGTVNISLGQIVDIYKLNELYLPDSVLKIKDIVKAGTGENSTVFNDDNNNASGNFSHAEGLTTNAKGIASHVEGESCTAYTVGSHAEGKNTKAGGKSDDDINSNGSYAHSEGVDTIAYSRGSHSEGISTNALGVGSHSEGISTNALGVGSHSEGNNTNASGDYSHTEGYETEAINGITHAEGFKTKAAGLRSHVEGIQSETGVDATGAHAEGWSTIANGQGSHSEGVSSIANGNYSHSEGYKTQANGAGSHAEGNNTIANANYSHVQGKYNEIDEEKKYAHIVGGGSSDTDRKNIHTIDWSGNGWYAGELKVGGTGQDDENAMPVVTTAYMKPLLLDADMAETYLNDSSYGDAALEAIKAGRQIMVKVPNADGGNYTVNYSPIYMYQVPNYENQYLYIFFLRDEKQDLTSYGIPVLMPTYGQLKMLLSVKYNSNPLIS